MEAQNIELLFIDRRETLARIVSIIFIERIVGTLHAIVEKIAGIGIPAVIGQFRIAAVHGKISGGRGVATREQPRAGARKAKQVKNIGLRTVWNTTHRVGQFVKRDADQQVRIDVGGKGGTAVVGSGVV